MRLKCSSCWSSPSAREQNWSRSKEVHHVPLREERSRIQRIFLQHGGKLAKGEDIQPLHLIIQLILFFCHLAFAPLIHRGDYALPIHRRNHCCPFICPLNGSPSSLFGLTFPLKSSAAARYLRIRSGCFGDILSVIRRRLNWSELCITPTAVCRKHSHHRQREKCTQTKSLRTFNLHRMHCQRDINPHVSAETSLQIGLTSRTAFFKAGGIQSALFVEALNLLVLLLPERRF